MAEGKLTENTYRELADATSSRMLSELPSEAELAQQLSFSPEFEQKMGDFLQNPNSARTHPRRSLRVLAIASAIILLAASALMSVSATREAIFEFFTDLYENYIVAWYAPENEALTAPETILEFRKPDLFFPGIWQKPQKNQNYFTPSFMRIKLETRYALNKLFLIAFSSRWTLKLLLSKSALSSRVQ